MFSSLLGLLADLREAIAADQLLVHYQPQVDIRSGRVVGVEALVRWEHPQHGFLSPADFVPLAEHSSQITPLTQLVLRTALEDLRAWSGSCPMTVSVNISPRSLLDPGLSTSWQTRSRTPAYRPPTSPWRSPRPA